MKIASRFVSIIFTSALLFTGAGRVMAAPPHGLCFNYGHDGYVHDLSPGGQVERDFQRLLGGGVRCLRIAYNGFNDVQAEALARFAKTRGFYVISGGEWGQLDVAQLPQYRAQVIQQAKWAQANGIDQLSVGNEQEDRLSGISLTRWANEVVALAADVRGVFFGTVSYEAPATYADEWAKANIGSLDLLGLNTYYGYERNAAALAENVEAHGASRVYISEINCNLSERPLCATDAGLAAEMKEDLLRLIRENPQTAFYVYTWRAVGRDAAFSLVSYPDTLALLGIK
ncbi:MAG TPA: hypothetical protein VK825_12575 [Xanthobacteraceae bacterium]|jgi:hypothetical protein|nr:hypothetical protein [Xanthobacteraceae bacterium]